ncbi:hypothetical protein RDWZM_006941 [Blomia tropicalis]|uniref:Uncharacterized protein n=1 Tax=Blomia tropicalis TaxID=40697 RepID=A0A9Q0M915_BLOTA|nr:hypothetical protein RDWZM_006941 [Blomia tropicalis]
MRTKFGSCRYHRPTHHLLLWIVLFNLWYIINRPDPIDSITITTVYAGKKKFKTYNLGIPFLPTMVKVLPNKFNLAFRSSRYIRPPKFKVEGSIPLKVPTIIMEKPPPYQKEEIININKVINLAGSDSSDNGYNGGGGGGGGGEQYAAASSNQINEPVQESSTDGGKISEIQDMNPSDSFANYQSISPSSPPPGMIPSPPEMIPPPPQGMIPPSPPGMIPPPTPGMIPPSSEMIPPPPQGMIPPPPPPGMIPPPSSGMMPFDMNSFPLSSHFLPIHPYMSNPFDTMPNWTPPSETVTIVDEFLNRKSSEPSSQSEKIRTKRSLNLVEPYHHHLRNGHTSSSSRSRSRSYVPSKVKYDSMVSPIHSSSSPYHFAYPGSMPIHSPFQPMPTQSYFVPSPMLFPPIHYQRNDIAKRNQNVEPESEISALSSEPHVSVIKPSIPETIPIQSEPMMVSTLSPEETIIPSQRIPSSVPMKINIGEHYNPNMVYMDETMIPNLEDAPLLESGNVPSLMNAPTVSTIPTETIAMESNQYPGYEQQSYEKPYDTGPDDFRITLNLSGVHGGKKLPYGTGRRIERFYEHLKKYEGNTIPVGLPPDQVAKFYSAHTFTNGMYVYKKSSARFIKPAKLLKLLLG